MKGHRHKQDLSRQKFDRRKKMADKHGVLFRSNFISWILTRKSLQESNTLQMLNIIGRRSNATR